MLSESLGEIFSILVFKAEAYMEVKQKEPPQVNLKKKKLNPDAAVQFSCWNTADTVCGTQAPQPFLDSSFLLLALQAAWLLLFFWLVYGKQREFY